MNCEEFKQSVATDPSFAGGAAHVAECTDCATYQADMQALDRKIARALALSAPKLAVPELPEIDTTNVASLTRPASSRPASSRPGVAPAWFAVAATVVIAAVLGIRMLGVEPQFESLADQVVAHLDHEPYALRVTNTPISDDRLQSVVAGDIAQMDHGAGLITYAQSCIINGRDVPHLVIQGEYGPVTILLMPEEYVTEATSISGDSVNGVILPVGKGSIAIIGERDERLDKIQKRVVNSVTWDT